MYMDVPTECTKLSIEKKKSTVLIPFARRKLTPAELTASVTLMDLHM